MRNIPLLALPCLAIACAPTEEPREFVSKAPAATVVGEPETCIPVSRIRGTVVHDARTIDFMSSSRKAYRNTLPRSCPSLDVHEAITYDVHGGQLCAPGIVYVLENFGGSIRRGAGCGLGKFVPIEYVDRDKDMMRE